MAKKKEQTDAEVVAEGRKFLAEREFAESENRDSMSEDLRFAYVEGAQWDKKALDARRGRPCFSYNRTVGAINRLVGDQRQVQHGGKVRAVNRKASVGMADTYGGLIRDIEACSMAESIYAEAFKYAVAGAWGAWRVVPEYADDESFDQVLRVKRIPNPQTVYFDEQADPFGRGAMRCVVTERISRDKYKALHGGDASDVPADRDAEGWFASEEVRIAEYYRRKCRTRKIALLSDGRTETHDDALEKELARLAATVESAPTITRTREVKEWYVEWIKMDGARVLEGPFEYKYRNIPVVREPGRFVNIDGKQYFQSLIRHAKDPARTYNYNRSNMVETVALSPRAPYIGTAAMFAGREDEWGRANVGNAPYLTANPDPEMPGMLPQRQHGAEVPQAYIALSAHDAEDIRQTTGYMNPALDQQTAAGDAESGRALRTRMTAGDSGSYEFLDNFAKAIQFTWELLIDMIPAHYDTERIVRILGVDGREEFQDLTPEMLRDGKYDVTVTLGPAYATARMEALDSLMEASERMPIIAEVAPDIIIANLDVKGSDEIERRVRRRLISQGVVEPTEQEIEQGITPPQPDPVQEALAEQVRAKAARDNAAATKTNIESATSMAQAESAERREQLELAQMVAELTLKKVETMLAQKLLIAPSEDRVSVNV